jgi:thioredoxin-dependent peroxiredoxin
VVTNTRPRHAVPVWRCDESCHKSPTSETSKRSRWPQFPKAYTRGCTLECKSLAEHGDLIKRFDVTDFVINVDPLDKNTGFAERQHADSALLSDPTKKTMDAYGVLGMLGMANRWTFYIGKDGTIQAIDKNVKPATSAEDIAAKVHALGIPTRGQ